MTIEEMIKVKAQEVRLALLEQLSKEAAVVAGLSDPTDRHHLLPELVSVLNQLDPSCAGIGGYTLARIDESKSDHQS